jgi:hypothetical protein
MSASRHSRYCAVGDRKWSHEGAICPLPWAWCCPTCLPPAKA